MSTNTVMCFFTTGGGQAAGAGAHPRAVRADRTVRPLQGHYVRHHASRRTQVARRREARHGHAVG